ncbi:MAG: helix-turn-helix domain-containing protein [Chlamydiales bacterium]|nr:helix-turn-helix domain-containing protein [Chlamydiales bacterium]
MSNKKMFVLIASESKTNFSALCERFNISRECGYKWLRRYRQMGLNGLEEQSRKPLSSPRKTDSICEAKILAVRDKHPAWGARKIHAYLRHRETESLPTASTIISPLGK